MLDTVTHTPTTTTINNSDQVFNKFWAPLTLKKNGKIKIKIVGVELKIKFMVNFHSSFQNMFWVQPSYYILYILVQWCHTPYPDNNTTRWVYALSGSESAWLAFFSSSLKPHLSKRAHLIFLDSIELFGLGYG
jgi:hypothetical protein